MPATKQAPQQFVDSEDGVRIAVYEEGNPEGPIVVLVHGFPDSHVLWDGVVPLLADRFRIIRYDNRGVGLSSAPKPVSAYTMDAVRRRLRRGDRRAEPRPAGARAGPRLGLGGHLALPEPARCQRPGRLVHLGVRPEPGPAGRLHLQRSAPSLAPAQVRRGRSARRCGSATWCSSRSPCSRRCSFGLTLSIPARCGETWSTTSRSSRSITRRNLASDAARSVKTYPANYFRSFSGARRHPRRRRAGAADRQHQGQVRAAVRLRRHRRAGCRGCGGATSRPVTSRRCRTRR